MWTDELARLRAVLRESVDRVPGGARASAAAALLGAAVLLAVLAGIAATSAPLMGIPVLVAAVGIVPFPRARDRHLVWAALSGFALLGLVGAWWRGSFPVASTAALVPAMLVAAVLGGVFAARERRITAALESARAAVDAVSVRDPLTGVANRAGLELIGRQVVETARRQGDAAHCTFVEIGGLAEARGAHGPEAVSDVLVALAEALRGVTRTTDVVARWKDSIFCVVGQGAGMDPAELERRVRRRLGADAALDRNVWSGRITVGGAMLPPWDSGTLETLVVRAAEELRARGTVRPVVDAPVPRHDPAT